MDQKSEQKVYKTHRWPLENTKTNQPYSARKKHIPAWDMLIESLIFKKVAKLMIFMVLSKNPIVGCDWSSPGPPHLEHIGSPKSLPV